MMYDYKIQKLVDGNGDERFDILTTKTEYHRWWRKKRWMKLNRYPIKTSYATLDAAQSIIKKEIESDAKTEYQDNKKKTTVIKEYKYTDIPNHIPEEQHENFCDFRRNK